MISLNDDKLVSILISQHADLQKRHTKALAIDWHKLENLVNGTLNGTDVVSNSEVNETTRRQKLPGAEVKSTRLSSQ